MTLLKFDEVMAKQDLPTKDVPVPEWGGSVRIRHWTLAERAEMLRRNETSEEKENVGAWLVASLTVDEQGNPWCPADRVIELQKKNPKAIDTIAAAILELNAVTKDTIDAAEKK